MLSSLSSSTIIKKNNDKNNNDNDNIDIDIANQSEEEGQEQQQEQQNNNNMNVNVHSFNTAFHKLANIICNCIIKSDLKREGTYDGPTTGYANWINEESSFILQSFLEDEITLKSITTASRSSSSSSDNNNNDIIYKWNKFMKTTPSPFMIELTNELRNEILVNTSNNTNNKTNTKKNNDDDQTSSSSSLLSDEILYNISINTNPVNQTRQDILNRIGCRIICIPSGSTLSVKYPLQTPPGGLIYGKLLYGGGITRYRLLPNRSNPNNRRRAGERTVIYTSNSKQQKREESTTTTTTTTWLQYGGSDRNYDTIDIGPCCILEIILLPIGMKLPLLSIDNNNNNKQTNIENEQQQQHDNNNNNKDKDQTLPPNYYGHVHTDIMSILPGGEGEGEGESERYGSSSSNNNNNDNYHWNSNIMFDFVNNQKEENDDNKEQEEKTINHEQQQQQQQEQKSDNNSYYDYETSFTSSVGGLQKEIQAIVRRVLDGRVIVPAVHQEQQDGNNNNNTITTNNIQQEEAKILSELGLTPVKGLLLYGPPGCGKTALARIISKCINNNYNNYYNEPKIVSAPELLDKWVGGTEKLIRNLFIDAENELKLVNGDVTKSSLHIIVIDEIDAIFRKRTSGDDSGEVVRSSAVNQILAKLDGINNCGNILLIGLTNRRELLDDALLRPGRLEVQIEIPLPNIVGRREILQIHFHTLRQNGCLSKPLCDAIDGRKKKTYININNNDDDDSTSKRVKLSLLFDSLLLKVKRQQQGQQQQQQQYKKRRRPNWSRRRIRRQRRQMSFVPFDLAASTDGFTGADIAGLVRCAGSIALSRIREQNGNIDDLLITLDDVIQALDEVEK